MIAPIAVSVEVAAMVVGLSRTTMWELVRNGEIPAKRVGLRRVLVTVDDLRQFIAAQENYAP